MLSHLAKAVAQLDDSRLRHVLWLSVGLSVFLFVALWVGLWFAVGAIPAEAVPGVAWLQERLGTAYDWFAGFAFAAGMLLLTLMLFPAVVTLVVGFFLESVAEAVEKRHYPSLPAARDQSLSETVFAAARFALVVLVVNLLALPFYALLFFVPPLNLVLFYLINGYLVSREYFELVALRRVDPPEAALMRRAYRGRLQLGGMLLVLLMTVPLVNLLTPVIATAFMVHVFENLPHRRDAA